MHSLALRARIPPDSLHSRTVGPHTDLAVDHRGVTAAPHQLPLTDGRDRPTLLLDHRSNQRGPKHEAAGLSFFKPGRSR
jgi:hypothetical protein